MSSGYRNPVIAGFQPDPSVCRIDDSYVLATSSFTYFPGVPIFRSTDLVTWTQVGNALDRPSQLDLSKTDGSTSAGVMAPTIRYHDGRLWMITTVIGQGEGGFSVDNFFVTAEDPAGPWSDPVPVGLPGIDPDLAWDDDGTCWAHFSLGAIFRCRIDDRTGEVLDGPEQTWSGTGLQFPEAPHLLRRGDRWYLLLAEGGTDRGHAVSIARGPTPTGPWDSCPANPIVSHRSTDRPIQSTGHADLVEAVDGSWWMVMLGTRPKGMTPRFHGLGRETFLVPVDWVDDWPVPRELELEMPDAPPGRAAVEPPAARDEFDGGSLPPQWVSVRRPLGEAVSLTERPGWLTLHGGGDGLDDPFPVLVGRRQQHPRCHVRARVEGGRAAEAGLVLRADEHHHYEVAVADGEIIVGVRIGPLSSVVARVRVSDAPVVLRIETHDDPAPFAAGPDRVHLGWERDDGSFEAVAELDGRYLSTEVAGGFTGRVIGLYAVDGSAAFDWFEVVDLDTGF